MLPVQIYSTPQVPHLLLTNKSSYILHPLKSSKNVEAGVVSFLKDNQRVRLHVIVLIQKLRVKWGGDEVSTAPYLVALVPSSFPGLPMSHNDAAGASLPLYIEP